MSEKKDGVAVGTRAKLIDALNEDLSREYQAIIAYVNYSQVLKGAAYMNIAKELEVHAGEDSGVSGFLGGGCGRAGEVLNEMGL